MQFADLKVLDHVRAWCGCALFTFICHCDVIMHVFPPHRLVTLVINIGNKCITMSLINGCFSWNAPCFREYYYTSTIPWYRVPLVIKVSVYMRHTLFYIDILKIYWPGLFTILARHYRQFLFDNDNDNDNDNENMFITIDLYMYRIQDARYQYTESKHPTLFFLW